MHKRREFKEGIWYDVYYDNDSNFNEVSREIIKSDLEVRIEELETLKARVEALESAKKE